MMAKSKERLPVKLSELPENVQNFLLRHYVNASPGYEASVVLIELETVVFQREVDDDEEETMGVAEQQTRDP
jgi:hypothetical protein